MAPCTVLWFVVLDADGDRVRETTDLSVALEWRRRAGDGARIVQEKRASGERSVQHFTVAT